MIKRMLFFYLLFSLPLSAALSYQPSKDIWFGMEKRPAGHYTVGDVIDLYGTAAEARLKTDFSSAGVPYPPDEIALLAFKREKRLELWARNSGNWTYVKKYRIRAASGKAGPKLREGDRQVPEGLYKIVALNPNSNFHLSMKLNYPNEFDLKHARVEGREHPGGNIFIHGKAASIGCLAVGDIAIEELFVLVHKTGIGNSYAIIAPHDIRRYPVTGSDMITPLWLPQLYQDLAEALQWFPAVQW